MDEKKSERQEKKTPTKTMHREKLIDFLSNPENEFLKRKNWSRAALGLKSEYAIYSFFSPEELTEIESLAFKNRRKRYVPNLSKIDSNLIKMAESDPIKGDIPPKDIISAAKLIYEKFDVETAKSLTPETRIVDIDDEDLDG